MYVYAVELSYLGAASPHIVIGSYVYVYMKLVGGVFWNISKAVPAHYYTLQCVYTMSADALLLLSTELSHRLLRLHLSDSEDDTDGLTGPHANRPRCTGQP